MDLNIIKPLSDEGWEQEAADREWLVKDWLPAGEVALLAGPSGVGKSLFALQLGAALACDRAVLKAGFLGYRPSVRKILCDEPSKVVIASWEDGPDEALRRRGRLCQHGGCSWAADPSVNARLRFLPMRGYGPIWAPKEGQSLSTPGELTPAGKALLAFAEREEARLLVVDSIGTALLLEENERAPVSAALDVLSGWALKTGIAVLLIGHPGKTATAGEAADYSGSAAWRGCVRSMLTLKKPGKDVDRESLKWKQAENDPDNPELVAWLTLNKSNYSQDDRKLTLATTGKRASWCFVEELPEKKEEPKAKKTTTKAKKSKARMPAYMYDR